KNVRYQFRNQSIYILKGHITWRYWLRRTRMRENSQVKGNANANLPCRVFLRLDGAEWFIYNRTPAYDAIIAAAEGNPTASATGRKSQEIGNLGSETERSSAERTRDASLSQKDSGSPSPKNTRSNSGNEPSVLLQLLPVQVVCNKGAIILGNTNTPSIVVVQFVHADL